VLPVPYEATVSYKGGTADGPRAIITASQQVELFDEELLREFAADGVATLAPVEPAATPEAMIARIAEAARPSLQQGRFLLSLGGEHSITGPLVREAARAGGPLSVLQIDAHADLRASYDGTPHSHAAVMRRVSEAADRICQVGIRSISPEEAAECPALIERIITPADVRSDPGWTRRALAMLGPRVYVTIDIDGLDPSIAPGTGTPEPGGLLWHQLTDLLRQVCAERRVVAADVVEVRPIPPNHVTEFVAARLAAKLIAYTQP
jgi:agmatinase